MSDSLKNVVIIGLGKAGVNVAVELSKVLPASHRIVAIGEQEYGYHTVGALRGSTIPGWEKLVPVPLDQVLPNGSRHVLLNGTKAIKISPKTVTVNRDNAAKGFSNEVPWDILIVATGSTYPVPARPPTDAETKEDVIAALQKLQKEVAAAKSVLVAGGGAIGVEYAGEVAMLDPSKKITLVHAHDQLHSKRFKRSFHDSLLKQLKERKVDVHLNTRVDLDGITKTGKIEPKTFKLSDGKTVEADFVLVATGTKPDGGIIKSLSPALVDAQNQIKVKDTLQVDSDQFPRVFALGDVNNYDEQKTAWSCSQQAKAASKNIVALISGKSLSKYGGAGAMGLVTLGSEGGAAQLPLFGGVVLGAWMARIGKSRKMYTAESYAAYNLPAPELPPLKS